MKWKDVKDYKNLYQVSDNGNPCKYLDYIIRIGDRYL